eukprot:CAMPEP_0180511910 /NCGR_PEP_ID=MMETSP1036_2-20121128/51289_1 /TAXON_ID=632150 /ORGANISM="Azadinium spinosum, Strain 3D9" /LENGTH=177 /DNA_ID=CAMNT_0022522979 /DNA_START=56 /DNA_END=589 /DNA_ORIENTATION=+
MKVVQDAWVGLRHHDKKLLIEAFAADGMHEPALLFTFLPLCFQRAKANPVVGLKSMMTVLAELIDVIHSKWANGPARRSVMKVDLLDLANFIDAVKNGFVFQTCVERSMLSNLADELKLKMSKSNWSLVDNVVGPDRPIAQTLREILQNVKQSKPYCGDEEAEEQSTTDSMSNKAQI